MSDSVDLEERAYRFTFTSFNLKMDYAKLKYSFICIGNEICPDTGTPHHQGYVEFKNQRTLKSMIKKFKTNGKVFVSEGTGEENVTYCSKGGDMFLVDGKMKAQGERTDINHIFELIKQGSSDLCIANSNPQQWCYHRKAFREYKALLEPKRNWVTEVILLWGGTGSGKTRYAMDAGAVKVVMTRDFIGGYDGEDIVLFDDVDNDSFVGKRQELLNLTDRYPHVINVKGGFRNWKPKVIYFTTNTDPATWLLTDPAFARRVTDVIHLE